MNTKKRILWITRTAILIALLVVIQVTTAGFGITLLTGSLVNLILIVSVMTCGFSCGLVVAVISPIIAKLVGIGPFWVLIPFIAVGNAVLIIVWHLVARRTFKESYSGSVVALVTGAVAKFLVLYLSIVQMMIPLLNLPEKQASAISAIFSVPQLFTALIGGVIAMLIIPIVKKATGKGN